MGLGKGNDETILEVIEGKGVLFRSHHTPTNKAARIAVPIIVDINRLIVALYRFISFLHQVLLQALHSESLYLLGLDLD